MRDVMRRKIRRLTSTMREQGQAVKANGCGAKVGQFAVREKAEGADVRVRSVTIIATRKIAQLMDSTWDAVVTSVGREICFIRRRKERLSSQCPLLCYEAIAGAPLGGGLRKVHTGTAQPFFQTQSVS